MNNNDNYFSIDNFKKWIENQNQFDEKIKKKFPIGEQVRSNVSSRKLINVLQLEDGQLNQVVKDFLRNGGKISSIQKNKYFVEVSKGNFYINKNYVVLDWDFFLSIVLFSSKIFSFIWLFIIFNVIWWRGKFL